MSVACRKTARAFRHDSLAALKPREAAAPEARLEEGVKLLLEKRGQPVGMGPCCGGEEALEVLAHDLVEHGAGRVAGCVPHRWRADRAAGGARAGYATEGWQ